MSCDHSDTVIIDAAPLASGEILVTRYCRLCAREWTSIRDRYDED